MEGAYICKVFGAGLHGVSSEPARLALQRAPRLLLAPVRAAAPGRDVLLSCGLEAGTAGPGTRLLWLRGEEPVAEDSLRRRLVPSPGGLGLLLSSVGEGDWGRWGCFASNSVGTDFREIDLVAEGDFQVYLAVALNLLAGLSLVAAVLLCRRFRQSNVELMEREKRRTLGEPGGQAGGVLGQLLVGDPAYMSGQHLGGKQRYSQVSTASTLADICSLGGDSSELGDITIITEVASLNSSKESQTTRISTHA
jgi:hypothetical protein